MITRMNALRETLPERLVVAIGGNATHPENIRGTTEEQEMVAGRAARTLLPLLAHLEEALPALGGKTGTHVVPG